MLYLSMLLHQIKVPECLLFKSGKDTFYEIIYSALSLVLDLAVHFTEFEFFEFQGFKVS